MVNFRSLGLNGFGGASAKPPANDKSIESDRIAHDAQQAIDHRTAPRHRFARETAIVGYEGAMLEVDLINLSGGGAMIEADIRPRLWDRVDLHLGEGSALECAVRWVRGSRIGLEFAHETQIECSTEDRDALLREVLRRNFPDAVASAPALESPPAFDAARRGDRRHPLIWNGKFAWQSAAHTVRLRNISASGVLIDSPVDLPEGAELLLDLGKSGQYAATVGWSRSGQAGLVFAAPFDLSALAAVKPEVAPQKWQRPAYLDRCSDQPSPWESGWERTPLADLRAELEGFLKY